MAMSVSRQFEQRDTMSKFLHTVKHDKRTAYMDPQEETYWLHFLQNDPIVGDYIRSQMRHNPTLRRDVLKQPVCPRCEGFTFFHKGGAQCANCGTWTPEDKTHSLKTHLRGGYYK